MQQNANFIVLPHTLSDTHTQHVRGKRGRTAHTHTRG